MSAQEGQTIALTGANGFIALHVALYFLERGWSVRGSIRTQEKVDKVKKHFLFAPHVASGKFELLVIPDLSDKASLKTLLAGVAALVHVATPFHFGSKTWDEYFAGAKADITNVLTLAAEEKSIKAVSVMTSSAAGLSAKPWYEQVGKVYTEADECPQTEEEALDESVDPMTSFVLKYGLMKLRTEQVGEQVAKEVGAKYALSWIRPTMVYGPPYDIGSPEDASQSSFSSALFVSLVSGKDKPVGASFATNYVDARDVAKAFYATITKHKSGIYLLGSHDYDNQIFANVARAVRPDLDAYITLGDPKDTPSSKGTYKVDNTKATKELGIDWISTEQMMKDTLAYLEQIGMVKSGGKP